MKAAALLLVLVACAAHGATRDELRRERELIEAEHSRRAEACKTQFVVTPCLDKVRVEKQKAMSRVTAQENALDLAERQARADARKKRLAEKAEGAASATAVAPAASKERPALPSKPSKARQKPAPAAEDRAAREQQKRADFDARQREIEEHRKKVEERNAERARNKPTPRPLPSPASGA